MIITVWERFNDKAKKWEHNHIVSGYNELLFSPVPNSEIQRKSWVKGYWRGYMAYLNNFKVGEI